LMRSAGPALVRRNKAIAPYVLLLHSLECSLDHRSRRRVGLSVVLELVRADRRNEPLLRLRQLVDDRCAFEGEGEALLLLVDGVCAEISSRTSGDCHRFLRRHPRGHPAGTPLRCRSFWCPYQRRSAPARRRIKGVWNGVVIATQNVLRQKHPKRAPTSNRPRTNGPRAYHHARRRTLTPEPRVFSSGATIGGVERKTVRRKLRARRARCLGDVLIKVGLLSDIAKTRLLSPSIIESTSSSRCSQLRDSSAATLTA